MDKTFREQVIDAQQRLGLSNAELARRSGVSYDVIRELHRRPFSTTSIENAERLRATLRIVSEVAPQADDALVPVYDVAASAGNGSVVEHEQVLCNMAFDRSFLRRMTDAKPSELAIIRVKGHSMEPTLMDDDHVLVDRSKTSLSYDGLFVLRFDDVLHVKRIGRSAIRGQVVVISDHPAYRDLDMPKVDLDVIGRVLWVGRKV